LCPSRHRVVCINMSPILMPMSKKQPECPLTNPLNCREYNNPKICAFVRKDRIFQKSKNPPEKTKDDQNPAEKSTRLTRERGGDDK
jgi:hypothetical protein